jgi:iron complex transport system ATP-binding protein
MIELTNIGFAYGDKQVLKDISLAIGQGESVALTGANGAGKTTLLKVISGALKSRGEVQVFGRSIHSIPGHERAACIAIVPQNLESHIPLTGHEFVMLGRTRRLPRFGAPTLQDCLAVEEAMASTATLELTQRLLKDMSGGERQRLALAMAFAARPRIILLDEATAHLDLHHRAEIMRLLREMNRERGVTVIMAAHDLALAGRYFDRLIMLREGAVLKDGTPPDVLTEETLRQAYGCAVRVVQLPEGLGSAIVPLECTPPAPSCPP